MASNFFMCGLCCTILSVWGVVQLTIMGGLYLMEPVTLFEEAAPHSAEGFNSYDEFKTMVKEGYRSVAMNCFLAAGLYLITLCLSIAAIKRAKKLEARDQIESEKDHFEIDPRPKHLHSLDMTQPVTGKEVII